MTGFGRGTAMAAGVEVTVEVRSMNGRYVEVGVRAPRELAAREMEIQNLTKASLERGRITVSIQVDRGEDQPAVVLDERAARSLVGMLERLRSVAGIEQSVRIEHLLQFKELFSADVDASGAEALWGPTAEALEAALEDCRALRGREGDALASDMRDGLREIEKQLEAIERDAPERIDRARDTLRERLAGLLDGAAGLDPDRLETEIAILADRLDVNEECVRLRSHVLLFRAALDAGGPVGRRLNFVAQEFNREINTIASKANDAAIAQRAVTMKEELEKVREQVQNIV